LPASEQASAASVDVRGKVITTYVAHAVVEAMAALSDGDVLEVVTDPYPAMEPDLSAWARMSGNRLVHLEKEDGFYRFYFERGTTDAGAKRLAIVLGADGLEQLLTPLGMALAAQLSGIDVHIYFMGPAVHLLESGFEASLGGLSAPFSGFARDGLADAGHVPVAEKLTQLHALGATFYMCAPSADHFGVDPTNLGHTGVVLAEYITFMEVMIDADAQFFVQ
jgi:predicted peroxiredoxin/TusA-related sulfurtransferase